MNGERDGPTDRREERNVELIKRIYGFDWAAVGTRQPGFDRLREVVADDFQARMSEETGGRTVGVDGLAEFVEALEQDFSEFNYEAEVYLPAGDDRVVVTGKIRSVGRASKVPLTQEFGHVWSIADGRVTRVEAHMSRDDAVRAAGKSENLA
ncbi:MAG: nuclear transport factor 2 family protein [Solirubrobacterales bacterium]